MLFLFRTAAFALPEVVIARYRDTESRIILRRFCIEVGVATSALALLFWATPASDWFFGVVYAVEPDVLPVAQLALLVGCVMPFINAVQGYIRGVLTSHGLTGARLWAILVGIVVLVVSLTFGTQAPLPSVVVAGLGLLIGSLAELTVLIAFWRKSARGKMAGAPA